MSYRDCIGIIVPYSPLSSRKVFSFGAQGALAVAL